MNKKIDLGILYRRLFDAYSAAYADKKKQIIQDEVNILWKNLKSSSNIEDETERKIKELQIKLTKKKGTLLSFFSKNPSSSKSLALVKPQDSKVSLKFIKIITKLNQCDIYNLVSYKIDDNHNSLCLFVQGFALGLILM